MATATKSKREIVIENIGPVESVRIPVPEEGGLVVLRGRNGRGKTRSLEAVESLVSGKGKLDVRDGELRGTVAGLGAQVTVAQSTRRKGELECVSLEGRLSIAELVDPGLKDGEAADSKRIKALVALSGRKADAKLFHELFGGRDGFGHCVNESALETDDLLVLAGRVKRAAEEAARKAESNADHAAGHAKAAEEFADGIDTKAECDSDELQEQLEKAIAEEAALKREAEQAEKILRVAASSREQLERMRNDPSRLSIGDTAIKKLKTAEAVEQAAKVFTEATEAARKAGEAYELARKDHAHAIALSKEAERQAEIVEQCERQIEAAEAVGKIDVAKLDAARVRVTQCRESVERGALIRAAREKLSQAGLHRELESDYRKDAKRLREAANGVDGVLSGLVASLGTPLRVEAGRLVIGTKRGKTHYSDLSHGERWKLALDIAIETVGEGGIVTVPQEAYESLDPQNRAEIAKHVHGRKVVVLTAEASDDERIVAESL